MGARLSYTVHVKNRTTNAVPMQFEGTSTVYDLQKAIKDQAADFSVHGVELNVNEIDIYTANEDGTKYKLESNELISAHDGKILEFDDRYFTIHVQYRNNAKTSEILCKKGETVFNLIRKIEKAFNEFGITDGQKDGIVKVYLNSSDQRDETEVPLNKLIDESFDLCTFAVEKATLKEPAGRLPISISDSRE